MNNYTFRQDVTAMRIPFISRLLDSEAPSPARWGTQKNIHHKHLEITRMLQQASDAQHLLTAQFCQGKKLERPAMTTGILRVDEANSQFLIDEFKPNAAPERLRADQTMQFSLTHMGVRCQFTAKYIETIAMPGGQQHLFGYPLGIEQIQLRDAFRVQINALQPVRVALTKAEQASLSGLVVDLSASGARIKVDGLPHPQPHRGDEYQHCLLTLSDGTRITCNARLMHWQYDLKLQQTSMGIQLTGLNASAQRNLSRYLIDLQRREQLNNRP